MEQMYEFIVNSRNIEAIQNLYRDFWFQNINNQWGIIYVAKSEVPFFGYHVNGYFAIPKLYGLMDQTALAETGITAVQNRTNLNLFGKGILVGIVDTGIDYLHRAFLDEFGNTRIVELWDQNVSGEAGRYTREQINEAIHSDRPQDIVPERDEENGHGTFLAGIISGSGCGIDNTMGAYCGVAPQSELAIVKLKKTTGVFERFLSRAGRNTGI